MTGARLASVLSHLGIDASSSATRHESFPASPAGATPLGPTETLSESALTTSAGAPTVPPSPGDHDDGRGKKPLDPALQPFDSPNGAATFLTVVGVTGEELAQAKEQGTAVVLDRL